MLHSGLSHKGSACHSHIFIIVAGFHVSGDPRDIADEIQGIQGIFHGFSAELPSRFAFQIRFLIKCIRLGPGEGAAVEKVPDLFGRVVFHRGVVFADVIDLLGSLGRKGRNRQAGRHGKTAGKHERRNDLSVHLFLLCN